MGLGGSIALENNSNFLKKFFLKGVHRNLKGRGSKGDAVDTPPGEYTATFDFGLSITSSIKASQIELCFFAKKTHLCETNI